MKYKAYMCATDFRLEWVLDDRARCPEMYKTIKGLKKDRKCWKECGIVEVKLVKTKVKGRMP